MELNLLHYTFTGDVENDGKVIGSGRVEESEGGSDGSGGNVGGEGGSDGSGGNVGGEGGKEQRVVGEVLVVGVAGDIKIVSQVYLHFFFFIIYVSTFKTFLLSLSSIHRINMLFLPQTEMQQG